MTIKHYLVPDKIYIAVIREENRYVFYKIEKEKPESHLVYNFLDLESCIALYDYFYELATGDLSLNVEER